ncbi:MAG: hypothetical protein QM784_22500 [Polyangiaceae bacterium]
MHYAVRLKFTAAMGGEDYLPANTVVQRGAVLDITANADFGRLDLTPIQTPPADKPLYLQSIGVVLTRAGADGDRIEAFDPSGGPSFVILDLKGVTTRFDSAGWILPVGYQLRFRGPTGSTATPNVVRLDLWQFDSVAQVLTKGQGGSGAALPVGPAGGDLTGTYPNPYVSSLRTGTNSLTIGDVADGQLLSRSGTNVIGVPVPTMNGTQASGDLSGTYPGPQVSAVTANGTRLTLGAVSDGQLLSRSGTNVIGVPVPTMNGTQASGDLSGTYPGPQVSAVTANGTRLTLGAVSDGQMLVRSGTTLVGATQTAAGVYGQSYTNARAAGPITSPTGTANYVEVVTLTVPAVPTGQQYRLSWFLELFIQSGSEWGCRLMNKTSNTALSPSDTTYGEYRIRNAMEGWQIPHAGALIIDPGRGEFICALQVRSPTSATVVARNALLECYRVK